MGVFKSIVANLGASENKPTVRVRGLFRWSRRLTVYVPGAGHPSIWSKPLLEVDGYRFSLSDMSENGISVMCSGEVVSTHKTKEEALETLELIANAIAPSKWRYVRRFLAAWLVFYIFAPGHGAQDTQPQIYASQRSAAMVPYVAPQAERPMFAAPTPAVPAEGSPAARAPEAANNDPFGLQLTPEGK
jgi:hypothetical protein